MNPLEIYKMLYLMRRSEELIGEHYKENEMKTPMHMSMGEEAIVGGVIAALKERDQVFGTYRSHALFLAKTGDADSFFAELYGKESGPARGKAGSMHLADPSKNVMLTSAVVATTIPVAVGAALASKMQKKRNVTVVFFGDGATDEGAFWESLNFACLKRLPILFVCEDNNLAIHSHIRERQGYKSIEKVVSEFNCLVSSSDSTDVFEIAKLTTEILKKMKQINQPGFLHLKYYRYLEHVGVEEDFYFKYRPKQEFLKWKKVDPLTLARRHLLKKSIKKSEIVHAEDTVNKKILVSIEKAKKAEYPKVRELFDHIYAE